MEVGTVRLTWRSQAGSRVSYAIAHGRAAVPEVAADGSEATRFLHISKVYCMALTVSKCVGKPHRQKRMSRRILRARKAESDSSIFQRIADIYSKANETAKASRWYQLSSDLQPTQTGHIGPQSKSAQHDQATSATAADEYEKTSQKQADRRVKLQAAPREFNKAGAWIQAVPSTKNLKDLRALQSHAGWSSAMTAKILELCERRQPHLAELCLRPMLQAATVPLAASRAVAKVITQLAEGGLPGLFQAEALMERLLDLLHWLQRLREVSNRETQRETIESIRLVLLRAGPRLVEMCIVEGCTWQGERWLVHLMQLGYAGSLRGQLCERLAMEDVLKAESWMVAWVHEHVTHVTTAEEAEVPKPPKPQSCDVAALCKGFLRDPLTHFKVIPWLELALEVGIVLDVIDFEPVLTKMVQFNRIQKRPYILGSLIRKCCDFDHIILAEKLTDLSIQHAFEPQQMVSILMSHLAQHGRSDQAKPWINKMLNHRLVPDAQTFVVCIRATRDVATSSELLAKMIVARVETNCYIYSAVIDTCAVADSAALAVAWFEEAKTSGVQLNTHCYNAVLNAHTRSQDADSAVGWIQNMSADSISPDEISYNSVLSSFAATGPDATSKAEAILSQMQAASIAPTMQTYINLLHVAARSGDMCMAETWYERMLASGFSPDGAILRILINAAATSGDVSRAEFWFKAAMSSGEPQQDQQVVYNTLMKAYAKANEVQKAEGLFLSMLKVCKPSEITFGILMEGRASIGHLEGVRYWQQRFRETGGEINLVMYNLLLKACAMATPQEGTEAEETLKLMLRSSVEPNFISLRTLALAIGKPAAQSLCNSLQLEWGRLCARPGKGLSLPLRRDTRSMKIRLCR